ncbi:Serine/threonine protein kinase [Asanoa ishikariensis]|uniref:non-specific serine/threonine protein kinase n=2 Tax=Asanoa ishikariensis TaxID=137265 RepID=A0A1H3UBG6_9ACTN|nr:Serine/threonine protein kinase [Asanoa ishikariensis]
MGVAVAGRTLGDGRYELQSPLARGGMGEVWLGRDTRLDREMAVKFIWARHEALEEEQLRRFFREAKITARLEHPGVPAVYDTGVDQDGRPYMVMQRVHGMSVADLVSEHDPLPISWAATIAAQACAVLVAAHAASLVHRDLKPSNLMLEPNGCVKVLDFGLAVAPTLADFSRITVTGQPIGTPAYMAPEQVEAGLSEPATDLYALGCTLHEMIAGDQVFIGPTAYSVMTQQVRDAPPRLRSLRSDIPAALEKLVLDLLEKRPEDRPAGADEVHQRLLPFAKNLPSLPGVLEAPGRPSPVRMYAELVTRVPGTARESTPSAPVQGRREPKTAEPAVTRQALTKVRGDVGQLIRDTRFSEAAEILADAENTGREAFGATDNEVLRIRYDLANALFEGGDYRRAAPVYQALAADLLAGGAGSSDMVFDCRVRAAICQAMTGEARQALEQLDGLLAYRRGSYGADDPRTLELRKQIALLQLRSGQHDRAQKTLTSLLDDVRRLPAGTDPSPAEVADLLASIRSEKN